MSKADGSDEEISIKMIEQSTRLTAQLERDSAELVNPHQGLDEECLAEGRQALADALAAARRLAGALKNR